MKNLVEMTKTELVRELWDSDPRIRGLLQHSGSLQDARELFFDYLNNTERLYFNILSERKLTSRNIILRDNAKECVRVLKNIIRTENESLTGASALELLWNLAQETTESLDRVECGFLCEFIALLRGMNMTAEIPSSMATARRDGDEPEAIMRSRRLDEYSKQVDRAMRKFTSGLNAARQRQRREITRRILDHFGAKMTDWANPRWQMRHVISDVRTIQAILKLEPDEIEALAIAETEQIPFQITPYYLSLFNADGRTKTDRGVRAHVLPSVNYCQTLIENRKKGVDMDFMGEKLTSPIHGITRRYPQIAILKPFDSCPQVCVYCQRNWEVTALSEAHVSRDSTRRALQWIRGNTALHEILITGGDPLTLGNTYLRWLVGELAGMKHIDRIRIGTRVPVTVPFRIDDGFIEILRRYNEPGRREIVVMTHVEYPIEVTRELVAAVTRIRSAGVSVYNQHVFTYYTSRRYEGCFLRKLLKVSGINPYYTFNTKGKAETLDFRVPMARLEQERHEEVRLFPGTVRTDEPVYNVPLQGKSSLIAWQDHEPIMILADGSRVYRFYPWESRVAFANDYLYVDVPIYDYLRRLHNDEEDIRDYRTIWYYF